MFEDGSISFIRFFAFEWRYRCRWKNLVFSSPCLMSLQHGDRAWLSGLELHCKAKGESCIWIKMAHNDFHNKEAKRSLGYDTSINPWWGITQWRCTLHVDAPPPPHLPSAPLVLLHCWLRCSAFPKMTAAECMSKFLHSAEGYMCCR